MGKKSWFGFMGLIVLLLFAYNGALLVSDSVECNYALTAKEMVESGDWISPQIFGNYWFDKPVLFYWLTALAYKIFGFTESASRFFPAVFGLMSVALVAWGANKMYSQRAALFSAVILGSTVEFFLISKSIVTDATLFFFFSGTLLFFYLGYFTPKKYYYYGAYICAAFSTLTKGPIGFLLPGLIIVLFLVFERNWRILKELKLFTGTLLFALIAAPWYIAMANLHSDVFLNVFLGTHNFLRATVSEHPKDNVLYYYTLVTILAFFPWIGFVPQMVKHLFVQNKKWCRPSSENLFLIIWTMTIFVFFQSVATKYISYTYPMLFPMSLILGGMLDQKLKTVKMSNVLLYNFAFYLILVGASFWVSRSNIAEVVSEWQLTVVAVGGMFAGIYFHITQDKKMIFTTIAVTALLFNLCLVRNVAVPLAEKRSAKSIALEVNRLYPEHKVIYCLGKYPTSAVFYSGKTIYRLLDAKDIESYRPKAYSWSSKNIMPFYTFEKMKDEKEVIVLMERKKFEPLQKHTGRDWVIDTETKNGWCVVHSKS